VVTRASYPCHLPSSLLSVTEFNRMFLNADPTDPVPSSSALLKEIFFGIA